MEFGIALPTAADSWKVVKRAEELGFSHAWFYDTQMLCADCFVAMGAAAVNTTRIRLGTGVLIPSNRIAPVAACGFATLNRLAPGRIDFGVGTGFTGRRTMGMGAMKLADMEEYIRAVMALLRDETLETPIEGRPRKIRFLSQNLDLINTRYLENHRGHLMFVKPEERPFVTADLIRRTTFTSTADDIKQRIAALRDAGYTQFTIQLVPGQEHAIEDWAKIRQAFA